MPPVRPGPVIGLFVQFAMLTLLSAAVGLGHAGWAAGIAYAVGLCGLLTRAMHTAGQVAFGPADLVTLTRAALVGCVTALTAASFTGEIRVPVLVGITVVALVLDAVDGKVARGTGTATAFGARFDMEVDAFLILVLSCYVGPWAGWWVLAIGAMRYVYVVATWVLPWLRGQLFPRYWRKVVAAIQGIVLVTAAADVLPRPVVLVALAGRARPAHRVLRPRRGLPVATARGRGPAGPGSDQGRDAHGRRRARRSGLRPPATGTGGPSRWPTGCGRRRRRSGRGCGSARPAAAPDRPRPATVRSPSAWSPRARSCTRTCRAAPPGRAW